MKKKVIETVKKIPSGKVATYGQIAKLSGHPRAARQVGRILFGLKEDNGSIPWHRVLNSKGGISTYKLGNGELQQKLLENEGVLFNQQNLCSLKQFLWQPEHEV